MIDLMKTIEKEKDRLYDTRIERNKYLGEYKERVMLALTIEEVNEKLIYKEVSDILDNPLAYKILLSNEIDLKKAKKYIILAKQKGKKIKKIDSLSLVGNIGLVVCSEDKFTDDKEYNPIVKSKLERFKEKNLPSIYFETQGQKISKFYLDIIKKEVPELASDYKEISFFEKIFGMKCPIWEKLGGKIR